MVVSLLQLHVCNSFSLTKWDKICLHLLSACPCMTRCFWKLNMSHMLTKEEELILLFESEKYTTLTSSVCQNVVLCWPLVLQRKHWRTVLARRLLMCFSAPLAPLLLYFTYSICGICVLVFCPASFGTAPACASHGSATPHTALRSSKWD